MAQASSLRWTLGVLNVYISIHGAYSAPGTDTVLRFKGLAERKRLPSPIHYSA